jgi:beta-aspartyl-peptidase (threonine type)
MKHLAVLLILCVSLTACESPEAQEEAEAAAAPRAEWAIAIHGGAGVISKDIEGERKKEYFDALEAALTLGRDMLDRGDKGLDVVEAVIRQLENTPLFNAGKGAVFTHEGTHELDSAIMDGSTLGCGAVAGLTSIKNPITLARHVMEDSEHVFMLGAGAERFADEMGVERVDQDYYFDAYRHEQWQKALQEDAEEGEEKYGTVGCVVLDRDGNLTAGTSTGGMTNKRFGRVGDVPVIGAGTYANNRSVAVSGTGWGEKFIKNAVAHDISALVEYRGLSVREAAETVIHQKLDPGDGGVIAVGRDGSIALVYNSKGMFRGAADSTGRFEVAIWEAGVGP